jgi:LysR family transcriptional regulator for metE and metH
MTMIEIRHLHLIKEIAETGNMTRASKKLFLTQPSLSHQLKELESRLGTQLFLRINKNMVLTPAGEKILQAAGEILPKIVSIEGEIKDLHNRTRELRVSTQCYTCYHWLPVLMKKFRDNCPGVEIDIVTEAMSNPIDFLLQGKIDLAITNSKTADNGVHFDKLFDDEQVLLVHVDHPLAQKEFVKPKDFAGENVIIYKESFSSDFFAQAILIPAGVTPAKVTKMQLTEARVELVKAGIGITVLSRWLVKPFLQGNTTLKQIPITKKGFYRPWHIVTLMQSRSDRHVQQFTEFLKDQHLGTPKK